MQSASCSCRNNGRQCEAAEQAPNGNGRNGVFSAPPQSALGMMQMLEDALIEHAHTKPLLPSQLIRYREVQVPDGRYRARTVPL